MKSERQKTLEKMEKVLGNRPRKTSIKRAKEKAWKAFSEYIRNRDADAKGYIRCISCGHEKNKEKIHWRDCDAGHLIPTRRNSILFDELGVNAQCKSCNGFLQGNQVGYMTGLANKYGVDKAKAIYDDMMHRMRNVSLKLRVSDFQEIQAKYEKMLEELNER